MQSLSSYLAEATKVGSLKKSISLDFLIAKTAHAEERQDRHSEQGGEKISDDEILETIRKASESIVEDTLANHIDVGDRFIVREPNTDLNLVCSMSRGEKRDSFLITIITCMRVKGFRNQRDSWVIVI